MLLALATVAPGQAAASGRSPAVVFQVRGANAYAAFDSYSPDGCIETFVVVSATQNNTVKEASVIVGQHDNCTFTDLVYAYGSTSNVIFQIKSNLSSASLSATVPLVDYVSGNTFNVTVNTSWSGAGSATRVNSTSTYHTKNYTATSHFNGIFADARASGTVSDGVTNFTPSPSVYAFMDSSKSGNVTIDRS
jgi:hypothetical protein